MRPARTVLPALVALALAAPGPPAAAQQAPFSLDDRFSTLLDRIEELEASLETLGAERDALRERALADAEARARDVGSASRLEREIDALRRRAELAEAARDEAERAAALATERLEAARAEATGARADLAVERARVAALRARGEGARDEASAGTDAASDAGAEDAATAAADGPSSPLGAERAACADALRSEVDGVIARLIVTNPCRAGGTLSVRSARPTDPLLGQLRARFDDEGRAELAFPLLEPEARLRVFGAERGRWQDLALSPETDGAGGDLAVLRWEDAAVDLDLVASSADGPREGSGGDGGGEPAAELGALALAQDATDGQLPRFEVFVAAEGAPPVRLGVRHASRGEVARAPWCGSTDAARPRVLLVLRRDGALEQVRDELDAVPCEEPVPEALRVRTLRTLR